MSKTEKPDSSSPLEISHRELDLAQRLVSLIDDPSIKMVRQCRRRLVAELLMENGRSAHPDRGDGRHKDKYGNATGSPVIYPVDTIQKDDDPDYWEWREQVALLAQDYRGIKYKSPVPQPDFNEDHQRLWKSMSEKIAPIHAKHGSFALQQGIENFRGIITDEQIPEMKKVARKFFELTGLELFPVEGLVDSHLFMTSFAAGMHHTNYLRNPNTTDFTPEPDLFHETGHIKLFTDQGIRNIAQLFARATVAAMEHPKKAQEIIELLATAYWFSLEYSLIMEDHGSGSEPRIYGAGNAMGLNDAMISVTDIDRHFKFRASEIKKRVGIDYQNVQQGYPLIDHPYQVIFEVQKMLEPYGITV